MPLAAVAEMMIAAPSLHLLVAFKLNIKYTS